MIPTLIFLLLRKYYKTYPEASKHITQGIRVSLLFILCIVLVGYSLSQQTKLTYEITRNGKIVGNLNVTQSSLAGKIVVSLDSEVKTRLLFTFTAKAREETTFENGIITYSSIYRKLNGNEKCNKKILIKENCYQILKDGKAQTLDHYPIRNNMLSLYNNEPSNIAHVYSDNFQQFLHIQKLSAHHYKIEFPDGNYSEYYYQNGICTKIKVHHNLYSAQVELKEINGEESGGEKTLSKYSR